MDRGTWRSTIHGVTKSWRRLSDFMCCLLPSGKAFLVAQMVKNLPAMGDTWVQSLGWEDPLEKGMAMYSSILAWRIPWTEEPGGLQSTGSAKSPTGLSNFTFQGSYNNNVPQKFPDIWVALEGNTEVPGTTSSEPLLPS